ncbi:MAG: acylphosphatase [Candidatus Bipolaricaulota bacterium]
MESTHRLVARAYGRVQGVGYRLFAAGEARRLGLCGTVRNLPDGSVAIVAEGSRASLETLAQALRDGPPRAEVERVDAEWSPSRGEFAGFRVLG